MADVKQAQQMIPLITREIPFGQNVSKLVFGVDVLGLDFGIDAKIGHLRERNQYSPSH